LCPFCQKKLARGEHTCEYTSSISRSYAWGWHSGPLRLAVHRLKYKRDISLGEILSQHLAECLTGVALPEVCIVPVPLWPGRQRQRGYNHAALLARPLAYTLGMPYCSGMVSRQRNTVSQVGLSVPERRKNVTGAFQADPRQAAGKHVLLVDDVLTTGATLDATANALRQAGAEAVYSVVLSRAVNVSQ